MTKCKFERRCPFIDLNLRVNHAPILVRNPYTNDLINVQLFFDLLHKHYNDDPQKYAIAIDREIQLLIDLLPEREGNLVPIKNVINEMFDRRNVEWNIRLPEKTRLDAEKIILQIKGPE
ncbi:MAG: hypothetical protein KAQ62_13495 [Cyclobacteriaceae bacterium]|nr:hypothetical protein [Cyclobacteriaceae bacterium]